MRILLWISCAGKSLDNGPGYRESDGPVWTRMRPGGRSGREERNEGEALEGGGERDGGHSMKRREDKHKGCNSNGIRMSYCLHSPKKWQEMCEV